ncbi:MAG: NAD-dependent epimerase/dehydratase family protein [Clostridiales bacterium]|nr:NAD-dependent epimerase/dehydratase family protein [Clostridiales bacterium]
MNTMLINDFQTVLSDELIDWDIFSDSNILITGANGLIGSLLVKTLLEYADSGHSLMKVIAMVRNREKASKILGEHNNLVLVVGDVRDHISIDINIDFIIHCASVTTSKMMAEQPVETLMTSIKGTCNMLELAKEKNIKSMLYLSSMEVYGTTIDFDNPVTEEKLGYVDLTKARSSYPEGKRICELLCNSYYLEYGIPVVCARLAQTFGVGIPLTDNRVFMQFARSVINSNDIILHTEGRSVSNFCYTADAVRGLLMLLTKGKSGESYNICNDAETKSISAIAELVAEMNEQIQVIYDIPERNNYGYAPDVVLKLSSEKIRALGWKPTVTMKEAYSRLIVYLKEMNF